MNLRRQTLEEKNIWNNHFFAYMRELDKMKPIIWAGDLNVAPTELGLFMIQPLRLSRYEILSDYLSCQIWLIHSQIGIKRRDTPRRRRQLSRPSYQIPRTLMLLNFSISGENSTPIRKLTLTSPTDLMLEKKE
jgi:hypothetical protein